MSRYVIKIKTNKIKNTLIDLCLIKLIGVEIFMSLFAMLIFPSEKISA